MTTTPMPLVQVFTPDGKLADIPYDRLHDAITAGAKPARKVQTPNGDTAYVPADRINDALKAGAKPLPIDLSDADGGKENGFWQQGWKNLQTPRYDRVPGGGEEMRIAQGAPVGAAILGGIGTAGAGLEAAGLVGGAGPSLAPLAPLLKGAVGSAAGGFVGREAGKVVGQEQLGGQLGALAGGIYGAGGGKIPTNMAEIETVLQSPEAKARLAQEAEGQEVVQAMKLQDPVLRRAAVAKARSEAAAAKIESQPAQPLAPVAGPQYQTPEQLAQLQNGNLSQLVGERPSGITVLPEPRAAQPGDVNLMGSIPRGSLQELAMAGKPNAGTQLQHLGQPVLYAPSGAGISNLKSSVALRDLLSAPSESAAANAVRQTAEPDFAYRVRNQGEEGVPIGGSKSNAAHATTTLEDAQRLAPGRGSVEGEPQEIVKYDLSKLKEGTDYERVHREGQPDWIRQLRPLKESELQLVKAQ